MRASWSHPISSVAVRALAQVTSFSPGELARGGDQDKVIWLGGGTASFAWNPHGFPTICSHH